MVHTLSCADSAAKHAALSTNPSQQEGVNCARLDPLDPGCHPQIEGDPCQNSQQEGDPAVNLSPQERASIDDIPVQPGVSSQPDENLSQQEGASNDYITSKKDESSPHFIIIISDQEG